MIIGKPVIKVAVMDEDMQSFAVEKAQEAMLVMYHEQVSFCVQRPFYSDKSCLLLPPKY